jgi:hypothetical protein
MQRFGSSMTEMIAARSVGLIQRKSVTARSAVLAVFASLASLVNTAMPRSGRDIMDLNRKRRPILKMGKKNKRGEVRLPQPDCEFGYTLDQVKTLVGDKLPEFYEWMDGQTVARCDLREFDHELRIYQRTRCRHAASQTIYYVDDVSRFVQGLPVID